MVMVMERWGMGGDGGSSAGARKRNEAWSHYLGALAMLIKADQDDGRLIQTMMMAMVTEVIVMRCRDLWPMPPTVGNRAPTEDSWPGDGRHCGGTTNQEESLTSAHRPNVRPTHVRGQDHGDKDLFAIKSNWLRGAADAPNDVLYMVCGVVIAMLLVGLIIVLVAVTIR
uniref:Uncharacterized protein n=1 Tax=Anopheles atroparvus TaxID=41427 RepID=A0A182J398_ANOAO